MVTAAVNLYAFVVYLSCYFLRVRGGKGLRVTGEGLWEPLL